MALAILTAPSNLSSVSNEMLFVLEESIKTADPVTYPNYHFILDVYVNSTLVGRMRVPPDPENSYGVFDVSTILRDYVPEYRLKANYSSPTETYEIHVGYRIKAGEEYDGTIYTNIVVDSSDRTGFKSYAKRPFLTSDLISPVAGDTGILSNIPKDNARSKRLTAYKSSLWQIIPFFDNVTGTSVVYEFLNNLNAAVSNGVDVTFNFDILPANTVLQKNFGFVKLMALHSFNQAAQDTIECLHIITEYGNDIYLDYKCSKHPITTLAWLNPFGAYESYSFGLVSKKSNQVTKKEFSQLPYRIAAEGIISYEANGTMYGSKSGFAAHTKTTMSLTSHLLNDAEYTWLADLFSSPDVYRYDDDLELFVPCSISDTNYDYKTFRNSKLTPLQFTIQFADEYNSQYL